MKNGKIYPYLYHLYPYLYSYLYLYLNLYLSIAKTASKFLSTRGSGLVPPVFRHSKVLKQGEVWRKFFFLNFIVIFK